ncbi:MAG: shikimate dehydrogenase [Candidatus Bathyarchaeota archaeon]|nr:shikimate dehydrogenase [Candidatus Bathyarchaeota archaeon]
MEVSGKTRVCAIIGDPVEHSLSPVMHNAAFGFLGLNLVYVAFTVTAKELQTAVLGAKSLGIRGLNVTMPHKNAIINHLDKLDKTAEAIGAVNTVLIEDGKLTGYNTDGVGAITALHENGVKTEETKIVLLGAGGSAQAIAYHAAQEADELVILNRTTKNAQLLVDELRKSFDSKIKAGALSVDVLKKELKDADILVNATSVGMHPNVDQSPVPKDLLHPDLCVMDIIYNPLETKLAKDAKSVGAKVVSGLDMLVYQGAVSFEIWTNCPPPVDVMKKAALTKLKEQGVHV